MAVLDNSILYYQTSQMIANILNNFENYINDNKYLECVDELHDMWTVVYNGIKNSKHEVSSIDDLLNEKSVDRIWEEWLKDTHYNGNDKASQTVSSDNVIPYYYPSEVSTKDHISLNMKNRYVYKKLSSSRLFYVLRKSSHYTSWSSRFDQILKDCKHIATSDLTQNEINVINRFVQRIQCIHPQLTQEKIHIMGDCFTNEAIVTRNLNLYFSKYLLKDEINLLEQSLYVFGDTIHDILRCFVNFDNQCST